MMSSSDRLATTGFISADRLAGARPGLHVEKLTRDIERLLSRELRPLAGALQVLGVADRAWHPAAHRR
jgi:hypothetical protein